MKCKKETDYRRSNPESVYELKKVAIKLRKKKKSVKEISEITGLSDQTVRDLFKKYDEGGIAAIKPKKRGRKAGEKRHLSPAQEQELLGLLVDHNPEQFKIKDTRQRKGTHKAKVWDRNAHSHSGRVSTALGIDSTASG